MVLRLGNFSEDMRLFHIATVFNNSEQYLRMKNSFEIAGFTEDLCCYSVFDNSCSNEFDPYTVFNAIISQCQEPYLICCHQDVLLECGHGITELTNALQNLDRLDSNWALVGNAGCAETLDLKARITDPNTGDTRIGNFPEQVLTLDENFFVIKTAAGLRFSTELQGFHLYATDICLDALLKNCSVYVIDFHLIHLSGGNAVSEDFSKMSKSFVEKWRSKFTFLYLSTPCTTIFFSRSSLIRRLFYSRVCFSFLMNHSRVRLIFQRLGLMFDRIRYRCSQS